MIVIPVKYTAKISGNRIIKKKTTKRNENAKLVLEEL